MDLRYDRWEGACHRQGRLIGGSVAQLFVSHSSRDNAVAGSLGDCLAALGYESVFIDFDAHVGLVAGKAWREQLFANLDACDAVVFVATPASLESKWCHTELGMALWLRKPILTLLVDGAPPHELTADLQGLGVDSAHLDQARIGTALAGLGLAQARRWDPARSPFPGLRAFDESYAAVFFGRDDQIAQLHELIDPPLRSRRGAVIPVLGPSGSGKSSLVRAGLVPALRSSPDWVVSDPWTPSDAPLAELALALAHASKRYEADLDVDACDELVRTSGGMNEYVRRIRDGGKVGEDPRVLVVVDQAEELVTLTPEAQRTAFLEALATSCASPSPLRVVMTARTDMWDGIAAATAGTTVGVMRAILHVPPLGHAELDEVIREPARRSHLALEDGLVQRMVDDTGTGEALPLLAFTLARMASTAQGGRLTIASYDALGGVRGAISTRAAEVASSGRNEQAVAEAILHLVNLGEGAPHRRFARARDVPPEHRAILDELVEARLVVTDESGEDKVYTPAHEALLSAWPPLVELIDERHDDLRLRGRLERRAADWRDSDDSRSGLLSGLELQNGRDWSARTGMATPEIAAYLDASERQERRSRRVRLGVAALVVGLALTLVVSLLLNNRNERRRAEQARLGELAAIAERELVHDPAASAVAVLEGLRIDGDDEELVALGERLLESPARDVLRTGRGADADEQPDQGRADGSGVALVDVSSGGTVVATSGSNGLTVWDTADPGGEPRTLPLAALSTIRGDGRVAAVQAEGHIGLRDLNDEELPELSVLSPTATHLAFSPDGALLVQSYGTAVTMWDVRDPTQPRQVAAFRVPGTQVSGLAVLDDGQVLTASDVSRLTFWNPADGRLRKVVDQPAAAPGVSTSLVSGFVLDPTRSLVMLHAPATTGGIALVRLNDGEQVRAFVASDPKVALGLDVGTATGTLDPASGLVTVFNFAGSGYVFDEGDGSPVTNLTGGHTSVVIKSTTTAGGEVVSVGFDGTARLWDPDPDGRGKRDVTDSLCEVFGASMDHDSWTIAMGEEDYDPPCDPPDPGPPPDLAVTGTPPDLPAAAAPALGDAAVTEDFSTSGGALPTGTSSLKTTPPGGTLVSSYTDGHYRMVASSLPAGFTVWNPADLERMSGTWSVSARLQTEDHTCGLMVGDGTTTVTAVMDRSTGEGSVTWFGASSFLGSVPFAAGAGSSGSLSLAMSGGRLVVLVDDEPVETIQDDLLGRPTQAGLAIRDDGTCDFDDFSVRRPRP